MSNANRISIWTEILLYFLYFRKISFCANPQYLSIWLLNAESFWPLNIWTKQKKYPTKYSKNMLLSSLSSNMPVRYHSLRMLVQCFLAICYFQFICLQVYWFFSFRHITQIDVASYDFISFLKDSAVSVNSIARILVQSSSCSNV